MNDKSFDEISANICIVDGIITFSYKTLFILKGTLGQVTRITEVAAHPIAT